MNTQSINNKYTPEDLGKMLLEFYNRRNKLKTELAKLNEEIELTERMLMFVYNRVNEI